MNEKEKFWQDLTTPTERSCSNCKHKNPYFPTARNFTCSFMVNMRGAAAMRDWKCNGDWDYVSPGYASAFQHIWLAEWEWDGENE